MLDAQPIFEADDADAASAAFGDFNEVVVGDIVFLDAELSEMIDRRKRTFVEVNANIAQLNAKLRLLELEVESLQGELRRLDGELELRQPGD